MMAGKVSYTSGKGLLVARLAALITLWTAIVPMVRAFFRLEINYNEGWNVNNAAAVVHHQSLYGAAYGWTTVNYPALSFYINAWLHGITHDYLFTPRVLSLLSTFACCVLIGAIVYQLTHSRASAIFAALLCLGIFCSDANEYVGMDDPQMLAQAFFLAGMLIYVRGRQRLSSLVCALLFFAVGANMKHTLLEFPLAVLLDLCLLAWRRAIFFVVTGTAVAVASIGLNMHFGGAYFITNMLTPRSWSLAHALNNFINAIGPVLIPFAVACLVAYSIRKDPVRRIAAIFFALALVVGFSFSGGTGVYINVLFGVLLAMSILLGIFMENPAHIPGDWCAGLTSKRAIAALFIYLAIPMIFGVGSTSASNTNFRTVKSIENLRAAQARFDDASAFLARQPGPALCESMLLCNFAGKPYLYDPFNASRFIQLGKLDAGVIVSQVQQQKYGAIELSHSVADEEKLDASSDTARFVPAILNAVDRNYVPAMQTPDAVIYIPRKSIAGHYAFSAPLPIPYGFSHDWHDEKLLAPQ